MYNLKNPFENEENLQPWFEKDAGYIKTKKKGLYEYKRSRGYQNSFFLNSLSKAFPSFVFKNALIVSSVLVVILFTGSVALAAEATLPENYKPSTVLGLSNIEKEDQVELNNDHIEAGLLSDPEKFEPKPLEKDENEEILVLEECNLNLKYSNTIQFQNVEVSYSEDYWELIDAVGVGDKDDNYIACVRKVDQTKNLSQILADGGLSGIESVSPVDPYNVLILTPATQALIGEVYKIDLNESENNRTVYAFEHREIVYFFDFEINSSLLTIQIKSLTDSPSVQS